MGNKLTAWRDLNPFGKVHLSGLDSEQAEEISNVTGFSPEIVAKLHQRFNQLDVHQQGYLTISDLENIKRFDKNPFKDRIFKIFTDYDPSKEKIFFEEFCTTLAKFRGKKKTKSSDTAA